MYLVKPVKVIPCFQLPYIQQVEAACGFAKCIWRSDKWLPIYYYTSARNNNSEHFVGLIPKPLPCLGTRLPLCKQIRSWKMPQTLQEQFQSLVFFLVKCYTSSPLYRFTALQLPLTRSFFSIIVSWPWIILCLYNWRVCMDLMLFPGLPHLQLRGLGLCMFLHTMEPRLYRLSCMHVMYYHAGMQTYDHY